MTLSREQTLREMGLGPVWKLRAAPTPAAAVPAALIEELPAVAAPTASALPNAATPTTPAAVASSAPAATAAIAPGMDWDELAATVAACRQCRLCEARTQAVLGVGDRQADWLIVGEAPGAEEDARGEPFVGQAGKLLDAMLAAIGLRRGHDVYIANTVKCRPPENRTPAPEETAACWPYLERQIALIQPKLIVALGRPAAQALLQAEVKIGAARGKLHRYKDIPVVVTYHPAYLLRNLPDKALAWEDLVFMRRTMRELKGS